LTFTVFIRGAAERDVASTQAWYDDQSSGLGTEFVDEFNRTIARLEQAPFIYPVLYRDVRRAILHRFPFLVFQHNDPRLHARQK
jgi:hypothetical protein